MGIKYPGPRKDLEYIPVKHQGQTLILIRDHLGLVKEGQAIAWQLYQFLVLLDSVPDLSQLQTELTRQSNGILVSSQEIEHLIGHLDNSFLLDSERFHTAKEKIIHDFSSQRKRAPSHAGKAYPDQPEKLTSFLDSIFSDHQDKSPPLGKVQAIISPHIDIAVGKTCYAAAYSQIIHLNPVRVIILGIGHSLSQGLFSLTDKNFVTPCGILASDKEAIQGLRKKGKDILARYDFEHRSEHSIEFQTLFLQHLLKDKSFSIVPILCGSCQMNLPEYNRQAFLDMTGPFLEELKNLINKEKEDTLIIAGVDLSHIGPKFGHEHPAKSLESQAQTHDHQLLQALCDQDIDSFWAASAGVNDRYNVCGFSAMACLLEILPECQGQLLNYHMWHEEATKSAVSFAATAFYSKRE